jgi:hypothetical protein
MVYIQEKRLDDFLQAGVAQKASFLTKLEEEEKCSEDLEEEEKNSDDDYEDDDGSDEDMDESEEIQMIRFEDQKLSAQE